MISADLIFFTSPAAHPLNQLVNSVTELFHRLDPEDYTMILLWTLRVTASKSLRAFPVIRPDATTFTDQEFARVKALALLLHGDLCRLDNVACESWKVISRRVRSVLLCYSQQRNSTTQFCCKAFGLVSKVLLEADYSNLPSCRDFLLKVANALK